MSAQLQHVGDLGLPRSDLEQQGLHWLVTGSSANGLEHFTHLSALFVHQRQLFRHISHWLLSRLKNVDSGHLLLHSFVFSAESSKPTEHLRQLRGPSPWFNRVALYMWVSNTFSWIFLLTIACLAWVVTRLALRGLIREVALRTQIETMSIQEELAEVATTETSRRVWARLAFGSTRHTFSVQTTIISLKNTYINRSLTVNSTFLLGRLYDFTLNHIRRDTFLWAIDVWVRIWGTRFRYTWSIRADI